MSSKHSARRADGSGQSTPPPNEKEKTFFTRGLPSVFLNWRCWKSREADESKRRMKRSSLQTVGIEAGVGERRRDVAAVDREAEV
jgi:hypothetical protein